MTSFNDNLDVTLEDNLWLSLENMGSKNRAGLCAAAVKRHLICNNHIDYNLKIRPIHR